MSEMEQLKGRIAALEAKLGMTAAEEKDEKSTLASEIASLERQLSAEDKDEDDKKASDEEDDKKASDEEDDKKAEKKASEVDPNGIEEQITLDRYREVERLEHGTELTDGPSMLSIAPTRSEYVARLKLASERLDKVAAYLEKHGRRELAFRVDKIADAIDAKIKEGK